ncbi:ATP-dependent helicase HrpB [Actinomyces denticolens]|nr:ATP-dependent helicase HrpB [Actinomyces denticolens]
MPPLVALSLGGANRPDGAGEAGEAGRVIVTQPRRVAARAAAMRLASLLGEDVGGTVGYAVRGQRRTGPSTRIEVVTAGLLLRRLQAEPDLPGVGAVILDEVHERALDADLLLALLLDARAGLREDLALIAMSATLDAGRLRELLGGAVGGAGSARDAGASLAPLLEVPGAPHPIVERWAPPPATTARLGPHGVPADFLAHVAGTAARAMAENDGDALVFLPGAREVDDVVARLRRILRTERGGGSGDGPGDVDVLPLHGRLPAAAQDAALAPSAPGLRRVVVSTNVAESSLTVPGVRIVVDSTLAREPRLDVARSMSSLVTVGESRSAGVQRRARRARGAGRRVPLLHAVGLGSRGGIPDPGDPVRRPHPARPGAGGLGRARRGGAALARLDRPAAGGGDADGRGGTGLARIGRAGREGRRRGRRPRGGGSLRRERPDHSAGPNRGGDPGAGAGGQGASRGGGADRGAARRRAAALLTADLRAPGADLAALAKSVRGRRESAADPRGTAQWVQEAERLERAVTEALAGAGAARGAGGAAGAQGALRSLISRSADGARLLDGLDGLDGLGGPGGTGWTGGAEESVALLAALAHPEWIARRRGPTGPSITAPAATAGPSSGRARAEAAYASVGGTGLRLPADSPLASSQWLAVADVDRSPGRSDALIRAAAPLDEELALAVAADRLSEETRTVWAQGRLRTERARRLGAIVLATTPGPPPGPGEAASAVARAVREEGPGILPWSDEARELRGRLALLRTEIGEPWPEVDDESLVGAAETWLGPAVRALAVDGRRFDLGRLDMVAALRALLPWPEAARFDELAPERLDVPSGSRVRLAYTGDDGEPLARPVLAVRVQECFGWAGTPRVAGGRVPVLIHLLSPARRPVAVTDDLASFWRQGYPRVRAELRGRYPKHAWPEDPWSAPATRGTGRRRPRG